MLHAHLRGGDEGEEMHCVVCCGVTMYTLKYLITSEEVSHGSCLRN